jgi:hypothetical protein
MKKLEPGLPLLTNLSASVESLPRIAAYLQSKRRLPFNQLGIFRHYPELDLQPARNRAKAKAKSKTKAKVKAARKPAGKPARKAKAKKK